MKKINLFLIAVLGLFISLTSCTNPAGSDDSFNPDDFSGKTYKSSEGKNLTFVDGSNYIQEDTTEELKYKGTYEVNTEKKLITLTTSIVSFPEVTAGDKKFFGKEYSKDTILSFLTADYKEYLEFMITYDATNKSSYEKELSSISSVVSGSESVELLQTIFSLLFKTKEYKYSYNENKKLVLTSNSLPYYLLDYEYNDTVLNIVFISENLVIKTYSKNLWDWGDDYLRIKTGTLDTTNKTVTFVKNSNELIEFKASYKVEGEYLRITFSDDAGFLAKKEISIKATEKELIPFDFYEYIGNEYSCISAVKITTSSFEYGNSFIYSIDNNSQDKKKYYLTDGNGNIIKDETKSISITSGNFGDDKIKITVSSPYFGVAQEIELTSRIDTTVTVFDL